MEFWIFVFCTIALILIFPYIRFVIKRLILLGKLKSFCKKKRFKLYGTHPLWFFGGRYGYNCDFYIETEIVIISVKLFGTKRKHSVLIFTDDGKYFVRNYLALMSNVGSAVRFPLDSRKKQCRNYYFRYKYKLDWEIKTPKNILLINPVCSEIRRSVRGHETTLGAGEPVNGAELYTLPRLFGYLEGISKWACQD